MRALVVGAAVLACLVSTGAARAEKEVISTDGAPEAIGPYSQAIRVGDTLWLAGQIAIDPATNALIEDTGIEAQTRQVLDNLAAVLEAAGMSLDDVVSTSVFLADLDQFGAMNEVYATYFTEASPARATVEVARLPRDVAIEISAIAAR